MRIATGAYKEAMLDQFNTLAAKQYTLQNQVSTGLRVQSASDDPAAMQNTLDYNAEKATQIQYGTNITTLLSRANNIYTALQTLQTVSSRVGEISTTAASATTTPSQMNTFADEVNKLIQQVVTAANSKDPSSGKYLFGGTASGTAPFTATTNANGDITAVTYNGNSTTNQTEIGTGQTTSVDIPGANTGVTGARGLITDQQNGADFLNHLISLRDHLRASDQASITSTDAGNLRKDENNIAYQVANNGVVQSQLNTAASFATNRVQSLDKMITNESSADIMQTMVRLNTAQTAYQAALQSGAKLMQMSILNYLQ